MSEAETELEHPPCQHCEKTLVRAPDGTWVDLERGDDICIYTTPAGGPRNVPHAPMPRVA